MGDFNKQEDDLEQAMTFGVLFLLFLLGCFIATLVTLIKLG